MQRNMNKGLTIAGAVAAAALLLAPQAQATPWCPAINGNAIVCSNCSRELTCDVNGMGLWLEGNNITLDGKGFTVWYSPHSAVEVNGIGTRIKNLNIYGAGESGIRFNSTVSSGTTSYIDQVYIASVGWEGITKPIPQPLEITNSQIYYPGGDGVYGVGIRVTSMLNTIIYAAGRGGYSAFGNGSRVIGNSISHSAEHGIVSYNTRNLLIENNTVDNNQAYGMYLSDAGGTFRNNNGSNNWITDCFEAHGAGVPVAGYGNNFPNRTGTGCAP